MAALADEVFIAHATADGRVAAMADRVRGWGIPLTSPNPTIA